MLVKVERLLKCGAGVVRPTGEPMYFSEVAERVTVRVEKVTVCREHDGFARERLGRP